MGNWGIKLQSTLEKAREKDTSTLKKFRRHPERYRAVLKGLPWYSEAWYHGVLLFGVQGKSHVPAEP
eukprot:1965990-Rhodomonas_salina.1